MKVGDKVHCIKDSIGVEMKFFKGCYYEINDIINFGNYFDNRITYIIKCDNSMFECWFSINFEKYPDTVFNKKFSDYFITIKELRMLKLKKLASV